MAFLRDMSERIWSYVSPRKTQQRRDKPFKVPAVPIKAKPTKDVVEMTPQTKVGRWQAKTPSTVGSMDDTLLPPSPPTSVDQSNDLEGDTLIHDSVEEAPKSSSEDDWDANEETVVVDDGMYMEQQKAFDPEKERMRQEVQAQELRDAGWTEDAVFLFQKLGMRGFEPLMPEGWVNDFDSLPLDLFTINENRAFIKPESGHVFRAQLALEKLFTLGGIARDAVLTNASVRTPEYHIRRLVRDYHQWAMKDAGMCRIWENLSLFECIICDKYTPAEVPEQKMIRKLANLQKRWSEAFNLHDDANRDKHGYVAAPEELPTLYGVIASHTIMAFVSYVAPTETNGKASLRMIATFDFGKEGYDVWNSLAIAIFIIHCRNRMKQLREFLPEPKIEQEHDPDL